MEKEKGIYNNPLEWKIVLDNNFRIESGLNRRGFRFTSLILDRDKNLDIGAIEIATLHGFMFKIAPYSYRGVHLSEIVDCVVVENGYFYSENGKTPFELERGNHDSQEILNGAFLKIMKNFQAGIKKEHKWS